MEQTKRTRGAKEAGRAPVERKRAPKVREMRGKRAPAAREKGAPKMRGAKGAGRAPVERKRAPEMRGKREAGMRGKREAAAI